MKKKTENVLRIIFLGVILLAAIAKLAGCDKKSEKRGTGRAVKRSGEEPTSEFDEVW